MLMRALRACCRCARWRAQERSLEEGKAPEWEYHKVKKVEPNEHKKKKPRTVKWP